MLVGGANFFSLDPKQIERDGLTSHLDFFSDCNAKVAAEAPAVKQRIRDNTTTASVAESLESESVPVLLQTDGAGGGAGGRGEAGRDSGPAEDITEMIRNRCEMQQRPYKWLFMWTGAAVALAFLVLMWLIFAAPSGLLSWLAIHTAVTIALLILSIAAAMELLSRTRNLVDCGGFDAASRAELERQGFACYTNPNRPSAQRLMDHWATIFWVGVGFSLAGLGLLSLLVPLMHWAKDKYHDTDNTAGWGGRSHTTQGAGAAPVHHGQPGSTFGRSTYDNRYDSDHRPGFFDRIMGRDHTDHVRSGTGTSTVSEEHRGPSVFGRDAHTTTTQHDNRPGMIDRITGRDRDRDPYTGSTAQPSFTDRITGRDHPISSTRTNYGDDYAARQATADYRSPGTGIAR